MTLLVIPVESAAASGLPAYNVAVGRARAVGGTSYLTGVSCHGGTGCLAVGEDVTSASQGTTAGVDVAVAPDGRPASRNIVGKTVGLDGLSCSLANACLAFGADDQDLNATVRFARFATPGSPHQLAEQNGAASAIACPSSKICLMVGSGQDPATGYTAGFVLRVDPSDGAVEGSTMWVDSVLAFDGIACPTDSRCLAVGATATNGNGVILPVYPGGGAGKARYVKLVQSGNAAIAAIACATSTRCVGVASGIEDYPGLVVPISGEGVPGRVHQVEWPRGVDGGAIGLSAVTCPSTTQCLAVGDPYAAVAIAADGRPGTPSVVRGMNQLSSVSCAAATECVAAGSTNSQDIGGIVALRIKAPNSPCTLRPVSDSVLLSASRKYRRRHRGRVGSVVVRVRCVRSARVELVGVATVDKRGGGSLGYRMGSDAGTVRAHAARTFEMAIPKRALDALRRGRPVSAQVLMTVRVGRATSEVVADIARLHGIRRG